MYLTYFARAGWQSWDVEREPLIPDGMPILVDDDLCIEDHGVPRPSAVANRWLQELPVSGAPSPRSWKSYAQAVRHWLVFLAERGVDPFADRDVLRSVLSAFAEFRLSGPVEARWDGSTWNHTVNLVARFYEWARAEGYCTAVPFTYVTGHRYTEAGAVEVRRNAATVRRAKPHVTVKYLEADYARVLLRALAGLAPDGEPCRYRGRHLGRNAAVAHLVLSSGLRAREFAYLLTYEIPALPKRRSPVPVPLAVAASVAKGGKARSTWTTHAALAEMHQYVDIDRDASASRPWRPPSRLGEPLVVTDPDWDGGRVNSRRVSWRRLGPAERLRLVTPDGSSPVVALTSTGAPFTDWGTLLRRTSERIRASFEPRFPIVTPHTLRHSFAMATLEALVTGYYQRAAALVADTDADPALALYLTKADPLMILRDLLGHSSVTTTEIYVKRLDIHRIYADVYARTASPDSAADAEAAVEFDDEEAI